MSGDDAASIAAAATAVSAAVSHARLPALWNRWTRAHDRRLIVGLHERAIGAALGVSRPGPAAVPVSVEIDHELEPKRLRLRLRLTAGPSYGRDGNG